jgi:mannosyltransferase OCH1-like enzyme
MKNKYIKLTISIFLILTLVIFLFQLFKTKEFFEENNDKNMIPKKIWTFWNGEIPNVVNKCINTWKKYNPEYKKIGRAHV